MCDTCDTICVLPLLHEPLERHAERRRACLARQRDFMSGERRVSDGVALRAWRVSEVVTYNYFEGRARPCAHSQLQGG